MTKKKMKPWKIKKKMSKRTRKLILNLMNVIRKKFLKMLILKRKLKMFRKTKIKQFSKMNRFKPKKITKIMIKQI